MNGVYGVILTTQLLRSLTEDLGAALLLTCALIYVQDVLSLSDINVLIKRSDVSAAN